MSQVSAGAHAQAAISNTDSDPDEQQSSVGWTEKLIQIGMDRLIRTGLFVIAHRLSTVHNADRLSYWSTVRLLSRARMKTSGLRVKIPAVTGRS